VITITIREPVGRESWCQGNSRLGVALLDSTKTRKAGRGTGRWDFNLQILVPYRETFFWKYLKKDLI